MSRPAAACPVTGVEVAAYRVPTDLPESDGTLTWAATTMVVVRLTGGGRTGLGFTYADTATATLIHDTLAGVVRGRDALAVEATWGALQHAIRNLGRPGIASMAIAALDTALWDLKARFLGQPLVNILGRARDATPAYGSGGFTSYDLPTLTDQLRGWIEQGLTRVKMKVGRWPDEDPGRVRAARAAIGPEAGLMVDANGAWSRRQALACIAEFAAQHVDWVEEPVSSDDLAGLRLIRDRAPEGMEVAAGEYGYDRFYFRRMLQACAVDVLQADASRCGGFTGFLQAGELAASFGLDLSAHCCPALHAQAGCAVPRLRHVEYFHDHVRIERMLLDGFPRLESGHLVPDRERPGHGLTLREADARPFAI